MVRPTKADFHFPPQNSTVKRRVRCPASPGGLIAALAIAGCYVGAGHLASPLRKGEKREAPPHLDIFCTTHYNRTQLNLKKVVFL